MDRTTEIRRQIADLKGELAVLAGKGLLLRDGTGFVHQDVQPAGGALLVVNWCTNESREVTWYPSIEQAKAALALLAENDECATLQDDGWRCDLTRPGCHSSWAVVERINDED